MRRGGERRTKIVIAVTATMMVGEHVGRLSGLADFVQTLEAND